MIKRSLLLLSIGSALLTGVRAQTMKAPDITKEPTLYVVPYAHLDTQWRWEFPQTISEYLLKTMRVNFDYIEKYPHYVFNWTGANRYRLMKEYFPSDDAKMKQYVAAGRWFPAGSSMEEGDVNLPTAEGIIRQILYGNSYFRSEFGKASTEYMLPDCFGFPASLPSILAHAGIKGFSTQKLSAAWQPAPKVGGEGSPENTPEGIPFNVGVWIGPDGKRVLAALNPGSYNSDVYVDLSKQPPPPLPPPQLTPEQRAQMPPQFLRNLERPRPLEENWVKRIAKDGDVTGVFADYHYVGTGDTGGATRESTVKLLEAIVTKSETVLPKPPAFRGFGQGRNEPQEQASTGPEVKVGDGPVRVIEAAADQMFNDVTPEMTSRMPTYQGDLELINHSAGSLTSQAYHKRWVRQSELLADAAEKASVAAQWMGGRSYPQKRLNDAWTLVMGGHFHDTAAGTATPLAYQFAWNDDLIALNQFATVLTSATEAIASGLDTRVKGTPIVVYNSLEVPREDVVEAQLDLNPTPDAVRVYDASGNEVPAQVEGPNKILFLAKVPPTGYAVYDVQPSSNGRQFSPLKVTENSLENQRYRVKIDENGDVSSIYDKSLNKELLSAPVRLAISTDRPAQWPAWNMDFDQERAAPRAYVNGPVQMRIKENGPARISIEVTRNAEGSKFVQTVSLAAGEAGNRVEFSDLIDWRTLAANLKVMFPLSASNESATYNWDIGTIQRPTENERQFEVGSHTWIDLTDRGVSFGASVLTGFKNGSDKPDDHTIRLTLIRTPGLQPGRNNGPMRYSDQANQDWGQHEIKFGIVGHPGSWPDGQSDWQGYQLNQPLLAFQSESHAGSLGKSFSLVQISNPRIRMMALKKAESSDEVILRLVEMEGRPQQDVKVSFAGPIASAREVNGQEQPVGSAEVSKGVLVTSFMPYQPRTFALRLGRAPARLEPVHSTSVTLSYNSAVSTNDDTPAPKGGFDRKGNALPAEMLPAEINFNDVSFQLAPAGTGRPNAVSAGGQTIDLPSGRYNRVYILAAAIGDQKATFRAGAQPVSLDIEDWGGFIGQWDTRIWKKEPKRDWAISANHASWPPPPDWPKQWAPAYPEDYVGLKPAFLKPAQLAWYASHHHTAAGLNEPYQYSYLFAYRIDGPTGAKTLTLPNNDKIRILAVSAVEENPEVNPARSLFDDLHRGPESFAVGALSTPAPQTTAPRLPPNANYDESKVGTYTLPDPLVLADGKRVRNAREFLKKRRPEIVHLFEENQYGRCPGRPAEMHFDVFDKGTPAFDGKALRRQVTIAFSSQTDAPKMDVALYLPSAAKKPVPLLLALNFSANSVVIDDPGLKQGEVWNREHKKVPASQGMRIGHLPVEDILAHGYGVAAIYYGDIEPDFREGFPYGVRHLFLKPGQTELALDDWGAIAAWGWGLSRAMDYLETDSGVDARRVALFGVSRLGKTVLWAGARDTRFAMVIASCSGEGGAALSRRDYGETVKNLTTNFPYQFCANYKNYAEHVDRLPVDANMLLALIAPRPLLLQTGDQDKWSDPRGEFLAAVAAEPVYRLFGADGLGTDQMPPVGEAIMHTLGYYEHAGGHGVLPGDWAQFFKFMDMHLQPHM